MNVVTRDQQGRPTLVELTTAEAVLVEIMDNLLDRGFTQGDAMIVLRGSDLPLRHPCPVLDEVLTPEFVAYLTP